MLLIVFTAAGRMAGHFDVVVHARDSHVLKVSVGHVLFWFQSGVLRGVG